MKNATNKKHFFSDVRFQLAYGIALMILIPAFLVFNNVFIITMYNENIDIALQRQALMLARMFSSSAGVFLQDQQSLQGILQRIQTSSPDILSIHVLIPRKEGFSVYASSIAKNIGETTDFYYYRLAYEQNVNEALATDSVRLSRNPEKLGFELLEDSKRFWLVSLPLFGANGEKSALLSIQITSRVVDDLTDQSWKTSVYSLSFSILAILLFLGASTRLWGYATLYRKMKEVDAMKDEFVSIASHELRSPIISIQGYLSMVLQEEYGKITKKVRFGLERALISSKRLSELVEDLLDVSRLEQGRMHVDLKPVDVPPVLKEVLAEFEAVAKEKNIRLEYTPKESIPKLLLDRDKFKQVLINIIGNALKYTKVGSVTVNLEQDKDADTVLVRIKDTGVGMSAEDQKRIFEKFFRVKNNDTKNIAGTGLGLWITKALVELMKGKISIESIQGTGTQVVLEFPVYRKKI